METKLWQAINHAIRDAMREDERVLIFGQDVAAPGGPFGLTRGLLDDFGSSRVRDAPISEAALVACAIGSAMSGLRPIVEVMYLDFITLAMDQLINQAAKYRFFTGCSLPLVVHTLYGGRANFGAQHSQSLEAWLCHMPGIKVAFPSTPRDAYGVLRAAIADDDPVVVINSIALLREREELDTTRRNGFQPGSARLVREGDQLTIVSYGPAVHVCNATVQRMGIEADLIDLRWLQPWNKELVRTSVRKTGRLLVVHDAVEPGGWGAEVVARVASEELWSLDAPPMRVGASFSPLPVARKDWEVLLPNEGRVEATIAELLRA